MLQSVLKGQNARPDAGSKTKELCLLSLDGGGVRGLASLLILKRIMESIDHLNPPKPCDYFDMIGGTSTGGLIAIMLGRLKMTVDECIDAYVGLAQSIFTKLQHRVKINGKMQGRFDSDALETCVKAIIKKCGLDEKALLKAPPESGNCRTYGHHF